ncbi:hypothetical protein POKO110462_22425 [Pontibacter korlensis]|uniref:Uncharacterized protein n=1 Tax=Pontibacter korlensis TaxID=400092 RepID=A0A0E3ZDM5_9BACT|nr:hypothetical protein [Pontibacter korlensis]AKD03300.1 hypothetical protein PKOR_09410 [Pontibacter korlensis]
MKKFLAIFLDKPTIVSILGIATIIAGVPLIIYMMTTGGGGGLGAFVILGWLVGVSFILALDRFLVRVVKPYTLSVVESVGAGLIFIMLLLSFL